MNDKSRAKSGSRLPWQLRSELLQGSPHSAQDLPLPPEVATCVCVWVVQRASTSHCQSQANFCPPPPVPKPRHKKVCDLILNLLLLCLLVFPVILPYLCETHWKSSRKERDSHLIKQVAGLQCLHFGHQTIYPASRASTSRISRWLDTRTSTCPTCPT